MELPPIFVINLKSAKERRVSIERQLSSLGCDFEFVEAVDGRHLTEAELRQYDREMAMENRIGEDYRELSPGEIGCALSHLNVYKYMVEKSIGEAVILEADAIIGEGFVGTLENRHLFPDDWRVVWLGHSSCYRFSRGAASSFRGRREIYKKHRLVKFVEYPWSCMGYLIKRDTAAGLLDIAYPIRMPADILLTGSHGTLDIPLYGIKPACINKGNRFESSIDQLGRKNLYLTVQTSSLRGRLIRFRSRHRRLGAFLDSHPGAYGTARYIFDVLRSCRRAPYIVVRQLGLVKNVFRPS